MRTQRSLTAAICLALVLATGISLGWGVLVAWITRFVEQATESGFVYEVIALRDDGLPIIDRREETKSEKRTLDGQPYTGPQEFSSLNAASLPGRRDFLSHLDWGSRLMGFRDDTNPSTFWYFVVSRGTPRVGWFEGFDSRTEQRVGFLVVDGFHGERPQRERCFPLRDQIPALTHLIPETEYRNWSYSAEFAPVWKSVHLASQDSIFRVDLKAREVHKIASVPGLVAVGFTSSATQKPRDLEKTKRKGKLITWENPRNWLVCSTVNEIVMIDYDDHQPISFTVSLRSLITRPGCCLPAITVRVLVLHDLRSELLVGYRILRFADLGGCETAAVDVFAE